VSFFFEDHRCGAARFAKLVDHAREDFGEAAAVSGADALERLDDPLLRRRRRFSAIARPLFVRLSTRRRASRLSRSRIRYPASTSRVTTTDTEL